MLGVRETFPFASLPRFTQGNGLQRRLNSSAEKKEKERQVRIGKRRGGNERPSRTLTEPNEIDINILSAAYG